ncbi:hypothetical protein AVEN_11334-1 [Araneus ventricosus]|uniref:Uncharacterized protein n=1 Tax=Araneus ventricosus TaxID=182803 RepID=A0A4Y2PF69_ARAVE|nr:hypothetical protein AVEN_11334-1 [Araneus ventricosus]
MKKDDKLRPLENSQVTTFRLNSGLTQGWFPMSPKCSPRTGKIFRTKSLEINLGHLGISPRDGEDIENEVKNFTTEHRKVLENTGKWSDKTGEEFSEEIKAQT